MLLLEARLVLCLLISLKLLILYRFDIIIRHYGVRDTELRLLISYLTNRKQYVVYNNDESDNTEIKAGVPQGFILEPLFSVFV